MNDIEQTKYETQQHINNVSNIIYDVIRKLINRAKNHDSTKLQQPELDYFVKYTPMLKKLTYGSDEYKQSLKKLQVALNHHYTCNRHHPEHFENGIQEMTLIDIVEMLCDWMSAVKRHNDGNILKSIEINSKRFGIDFQLKQILLNTVKELDKSSFMSVERYFYDCEFEMTENGKCLELISIAIVSEDDNKEPLYIINKDYDWNNCKQQWLIDNVKPHIDKIKKSGSGAIFTNKNKIKDFIVNYLNPSKNKEIQLYAYYSAYDHVALCSCFGNMIDLPEGIPMFTYDLKHIIECKGITKQELNISQENEHDALDDALYDKKLYLRLQNL